MDLHCGDLFVFHRPFEVSLFVPGLQVAALVELQGDNIIGFRGVFWKTETDARNQSLEGFHVPLVVRTDFMKTTGRSARTQAMFRSSFVSTTYLILHLAEICSTRHA